MDIGAIFVGLAAAALMVFYVTEPFRKKAQEVNVLIDQWVASVSDAPAMVSRSEVVTEVQAPAVTPDATLPATASGAKFCHQCGNPIKPNHRFCPNCGATLTD